MTQILNTHREKRKRIFLSLFFLQTNKNKTSIGGYLTCKSDILHIYSFLVPRALGHEHEDQEALGTHGTEVLDFRTSGQFRFKSKFEDSLLKALNYLFTVIHTSARASERY